MKPLLSELFLPCSGMHSPIRANRYPLTTITGAQRASGQTHSRARSHQDDADLRADRSTAYLVSCIRVRSAHGNSLGACTRANRDARRKNWRAQMLRGRQLFPPRSLTAPMKAGAVDGGPTVPRRSVSWIFPPLCAQRAFSGCPGLWPYTPFYAQGREIVLEEKPSQCRRLSSTSRSPSR